MRLTRPFETSRGTVKLELRGGFAYELKAVTPRINESLPAAPGSGFTLTGADPGRVAATLGAALVYDVSSKLSLYGRYDATIGSQATDLAVTAGVNLRW